MEVNNFEGSIGAEVSFDYHNDWTDETVQQLRIAFRERHLLLLRAPDLTPDEQVRVLESLGLAVDEWTDGNRYGFLSNNLQTAPNNGQHHAYLYHSDLMWKEQPIAAISLYAIAVPEEPAPTLFASGVGAAASMPAAMKAEFEKYEGLFVIGFTGADKRYSEETAPADAPRATHPLLYQDPVSGQTSLIVDSLFMDKVVGMNQVEGEAIREQAHRLLYSPGNIYQHEWAVGDLVVWNNVALQHSRPKLPEKGDRTFRRVSGSYAHATTAWEALFRDNVGAAS